MPTGLAQPSGLLSGSTAAFARHATEEAIAELRAQLGAFCADDAGARDCAAWAGAGECGGNPEFMRARCRRACGACVASARERMDYAEVGLVALRSAQVAVHLGAQGGGGGAADADAARARLHDLERTLEAAADGLMEALPSIADGLDACLAHLPPPAAAAAAAAPGASDAAAAPDARDALPARNVSSARVALNDGHSMPALGFGTWQLVGAPAREAVGAALRAGFRSLDTSENYGNEREVGEAIAAWVRARAAAHDPGARTRRRASEPDDDGGGDDERAAVARRSARARSELFVSSKLSFADSHGAHALGALNRSLGALQLGYLDLYMLHAPHADAAVSAVSWRALEAAKASGLVRSLGLSNFGPDEYAALGADAAARRRAARAGEPPVVWPPAVVQDKHSIYAPASRPRAVPLLNAAAAADASADARGEGGVVLNAYCALNPWPGRAAPLADARVRALAAARGVGAAQLLLAWAVETGGAALTRATSPAHLAENAAAAALALTAAERAQLDALGWLARAPWRPWHEAAASRAVAAPAADGGPGAGPAADRSGGGRGGGGVKLEL
jgi:2,5-diketo-D-gluconate reductase A